MTPPSDTVKMSRREAVWFGKFKRAKAHHEKHGHLVITKSEKENWDLRRWIIKERRQLRDPAITVPKERLELLESIKFNSIRRHRGMDQQFWEKRHSELEEDQGTPGLAEWISRQKRLMASGKIDPARRVRLEELGVCASGPVRKKNSRLNEAIWWENLDKLREYKSIHGNCHVAFSCKENPSLGQWVSRQRNNRDSMDPERKRALNELGFAWSAKEINAMQKQEEAASGLMKLRGSPSEPEKRNLEVEQWL